MKDKLRQFLSDEIVIDGTEIRDDEDLLLSGLVDSMGMMRLIAFIEEREGIRVPPQDVTIENFATIDAMVAYLERAQGQTSNL